MNVQPIHVNRSAPTLMDHSSVLVGLDTALIGDCVKVTIIACCHVWILNSYCLIFNSDINECVVKILAGRQPCSDESLLCRNTLGSFLCKCPEGTELTDGRCLEIGNNLAWLFIIRAVIIILFLMYSGDNHCGNNRVSFNDISPSCSGKCCGGDTSCTKSCYSM